MTTSSEPSPWSDPTRQPDPPAGSTDRSTDRSSDGFHGDPAQPPAPPVLPSPPEFSVGSAAVPTPAIPAPAFPSPDAGYVPADLASPALPLSAYPPQAYPPPAYPAPPQPAAGYGGYGGYAGYGAPGGYYPYPGTVQKTNGLATAAMVVSITGIAMTFCYVGGVIGLVGAILGHVARRQIRERQEGGGGMALAGIIVGWIAAGISAIFIALVTLAVFSSGP